MSKAIFLEDFEMKMWQKIIFSLFIINELLLLGLLLWLFCFLDADQPLAPWGMSLTWTFVMLSVILGGMMLWMKGKK